MRSRPFAAAALTIVAAAVMGSGAAAATAATPINLVAAFGTVKNSVGQLGVIGETGYNYTTLAPDTTAAAGDIGCETTWDAVQIMCDPAPTTDVSGVLTQYSVDTGYTSELVDGDSVSYIVVDLGAECEFSSLEVFQMLQSDGAVTDAELYVSDTLTDTWPSQGDASWALVAGGTILDGPDQTGTGPYTNTAVTRFDFAATTGRYVLFQFQNDGSYDADGYIEVAGVKLLGQAAPTPVVVPPALAATGQGAGTPVAPLAAGALLAAIGAALLVRSRLARRRAL